MCGCYYLKYPMVLQSQPCSNQTQIECIANTSFNYEPGEKCEKDCPLECDDVKYDLSLSSLILPSSNWANAYKIFYNSSDTSIKDEFLLLEIYFANPEYTKISVSPKITPYDLLAQIGGSLGMFLSLSIFTFIEIGELVFLQLYALMTRKL